MLVASMSAPSFDFSQWPVLGIYIPASVVPEMLPSFFATWERVSVERGVHVASFDLRDFNPMFASGPLRRVAAREVEKGMYAYRASLVGVARLVSHPLTRALLTAFDWMVPLPWPVLNTASSREGARFLVACAQDFGLSVPDGIDLDALRERERFRMPKSA